MAGTWMKFLLRHLPLAVVLLALGSPAFSATSQNPYDKKRQQLQAACSSADRLHKLVLMDQVLRLRDYIDDPAVISSFFTGITQSAASDDHLIGAEAKASLDEISLFEGNSINQTSTHWYAQPDLRKQILAEAGK